jgi:hypothetical protein
MCTIAKKLFLKNLKNTTLEKSTGLMQIPIEMKTESVKNLEQGDRQSLVSFG